MKIFKQCAILSDLIYSDAEEIKSKLPDEFSFFEFVENLNTDTQAGIFVDDSAVYVVFRGTTFDNLEDWYTNLDCVRTGWQHGKVHRGFYTDVVSVYVKIMAAISNHRFGVNQAKKFVITGHSQGAADAQVFFGMSPEAYDMCVTFGAPRVMDNDAVIRLMPYCHKIFRVVNNNDIVTRIPPKVMGYAHLPCTLWYFSEDGILWHSPTMWDRFKDRIHGRIEDIGEWGTDGIKDHDIQEYIRLVSAVVDYGEAA